MLGLRNYLLGGTQKWKRALLRVNPVKSLEILSSVSFIALFVLNLCYQDYTHSGLLSLLNELTLFSLELSFFISHYIPCPEVHLPDLQIVILAFLRLVFSWYIFFYLFTLNLFVFLYLKQVSMDSMFHVFFFYSLVSKGFNISFI